jgi:hypothetical protein
VKNDSQPLVLLVALIIAFRLLIWQLGAKSFWCDELFTISMAGHPADRIVAEVGRDLHPPLYFLLMKG